MFTAGFTVTSVMILYRLIYVPVDVN